MALLCPLCQLSLFLIISPPVLLLKDLFPTKMANCYSKLYKLRNINALYRSHTLLGRASLYSADSVEYPMSRPNLAMDPVSLSMANRGDCPPLPSSLFLATSSLSNPVLIC